MKLNKDRILKQILPSTFFIVLSGIAVFQPNILIGSVIGAIIFLSSMAMSVLLIWSYEKKQLT